MPGSSCVARMSGCTGTEGLVGTIACSSCSTLLASVMSAITNRDRWASVETVSVTVHLLSRLLEVEEDGQVATRARRASRMAWSTPFRSGREAAEDEHGLGGDGVDDTANLRVGQEQVDELGDCEVIDSNGGLVLEG